MCIIISCKPGYRPADDVLTTCFINNPDGAGIMWADGEAVHGKKGLMDFPALMDAVDSVPLDEPLVIHCRIGTSGGYDARVTHPYPITRDLERLHALEWDAPAGIAHNGVLHGFKTDPVRGISDTVAYIKAKAYPAKMSREARDHGGVAWSAKTKKRLAKSSVGSRLALMDSSGKVQLIGAGWESMGRGLMASNGSWRVRESYFSPSRSHYYRRADGASPWEADLPITCYGCPYADLCSVQMPFCEDVALSLGYSENEISDMLDMF